MSGAIIGGAIAGGAALTGAAISSNAAGNAASTKASAADKAAQLQYQASQNALGFQEQQYNQGQANLQPWLQSGAGALGNLNYLLGIGNNPGAQQGGTQPVSPTGGYGSLNARPMSAGSTMQQGNGLDQPRSGAVSANGGQPIGVSSSPGGGGVNFNSGFNPTMGMGSAANGAGGVQASSGAQLAGGLRPVSSVPGANNGTPGVPPQGGPVNTSNGAFGSLMQPYGQQFQAPTGLTMQNDPGYQARLQLGTDSIQKSAAARGGVLTGGTAKALTTYGQDYGSNEYSNVYNRALTDYSTKYNAYNNDQANQFNRLASMSGMGQTAAGTLASQGQAASNNVSSNLLNTASNIGQQTNNAAAANASGIVGGANAWSGALGNTSNNLQQLLLLQQLQGGGGSYGGPSTGGGGALPTGWA